MPPHDGRSTTMNFKYGNDCLCENQSECRGMTAAFSCLGNDPRSGFVRLPNYKENPPSQYYVERNLQREAYLRYLLPNHPPSMDTLAKDVALHHFHPRVVARLVSKLQKNIPRTVTEEEMAQLGVTVDDRDRLLDEDGMPTGRCIFAPNYPILQAKEDLKRLLRLCRVLNAKSKDDRKVSSKGNPSSSARQKKKKKKRFDPDIPADSLEKDDGPDEDATEEPEEEPLDSLAGANIQSLLATYMRLEPIPEDPEPPPPPPDQRSDTPPDERSDNIKMESLVTLETDLESDSEEEKTPTARSTATVSMQIHLGKLHSGKGKNRMTKIMNRAPSPFYDISVLHDKDSVMTRETIYRSYPLTDTKDATWDPIESLDLGVEVHAPEDLSFRITVFDCDVKNGNHLLIGVSDVNALDLLTTPQMSISIRRRDKIKGFLEISNFQLNTKRDGTSGELVWGSMSDLVASLSGDADDNEEASQESAIYSKNAKENSEAVVKASGGSEENTEAQERGVTVDDVQKKNLVDSPTSILETTQSSVEWHKSVYTLPSTSTLSMQISLEDLHSAKGKKRMSKVRSKLCNPFYEISVLHTNKNGTTWWDILMRSYPLMGVKSGTWDAVEGLDLGMEVRSPEDLRFRIAVFDCDAKGREHLFIGSSEVKGSDLIKTPSTSIPLQRGDKVKGSLCFLRFELDLPVQV